MKPSWSEVTVLGLLLLFAMVMANGWPQGDWGLGWGAIGAIASIVIGGLAYKINATQKKWMEEKRDHDLNALHWQVEEIAMYLGMSVALYCNDNYGKKGALEKIIEIVRYKHKPIKRLINGGSLYLLKKEGAVLVDSIDVSLEALAVLVKDHKISDDSHDDLKELARTQLLSLCGVSILLLKRLVIKKTMEDLYQDVLQNLANIKGV